MIVLYVFYALIGISILVFVHELGHFLAAKRVGVRVERFAIGFDPPIRGRNLRLLSFQRGETEYVLGAVPFGGYVKLAGGEMLLESNHKPAPDELPGKSVGARSFVFAAGSAMNILFAFLFFMLAFTLGVPFPEPQLDMVEPGSAAWESGMRPGDKVLEIDGVEPLDFSEVRLAVALGSPSKPIDLKVERAAKQGGTETLNFLVTPRWNSDSGFNVIGVAPAYSNRIGELDPDGLAARSGVREGDRILGVELAGTPVEKFPVAILIRALKDFSLAHPLEPYRLFVERNGEKVTIQVTPGRKSGEKPTPQLGLAPSTGNVFRAIQSGSAAHDYLRAGERWTGVNGRAISCADWLRILEAQPVPDGTIQLDLIGPDGAKRTASVPRSDFLSWYLREEIQWDYYAARVGELRAGTPLEKAGLTAGDVVTRVGSTTLYSPEELEEALQKETAPGLKLQVSRGAESIELTVSRSDLAEADGITWDSLPVLRTVIPQGPADKAGIVPGSTVERIGSKRVFTWREMVEAIRSEGSGAKVSIAWRDPDGASKSAEVTLGLEPWDELDTPFEYLQRTVRVSAIESIRTGAKRTVLAAKQLFLTLRSLIRREVSPKNLSGPLGITHLLTKVAEQNSLSTLIYYLALISINLGLFNLLPFPILDGGHLLFLSIEKIKGSPVSAKVQEWAMNIAFLLILFLAVFVTFNDLKRLLP